MSGYSQTPLEKKLGFKPGLEVLLISAPADYATWLASLPEQFRFVSEVSEHTSAAHVFADTASVLRDALLHLRAALPPTAFVWVSWPKKSSRVRTDITEDTIRAIALPMGFVDIKVCAVSDVWSGLKLVVRKELRGIQPGTR